MEGFLAILEVFTKAHARSPPIFQRTKLMLSVLSHIHVLLFLALRYIEYDVEVRLHEDGKGSAGKVLG